MTLLLLHVVIHFHDTITLGSALVMVTVALAGFFWIFYGTKWKANYDLEHITVLSLEEGRAAFQQRAERLEAELRDALGEVTELKAKVSKLEQATDLTPVLDQMHREHTTILRGIEHLAEMLSHAIGEFPLTEESGGPQ